MRAPRFGLKPGVAVFADAVHRRHVAGQRPLALLHRVFAQLVQDFKRLHVTGELAGDIAAAAQGAGINYFQHLVRELYLALEKRPRHVKAALS